VQGRGQALRHALTEQIHLPTPAGSHIARPRPLINPNVSRFAIDSRY
jgi:hypothetical protein